MCTCAFLPVSCLCVRVCAVFRLAEQQGIPGGAHQSVGGPERFGLSAEHGAERRRSAGAHSGPLLHLRTNLLQTALHRGRRGGGKGGGRGKRGRGSTACPVHLQEGTMTPQNYIWY